MNFVLPCMYNLSIIIIFRTYIQPDKNKQSYTPDLVQATINNVRLNNITIRSRGSTKLHSRAFPIMEITRQEKQHKYQIYFQRHSSHNLGDIGFE